MSIKKLYKNYKEAAAKFEAADLAWDADIDNEEAEAAWDAACAESKKAEDALKAAIIKATGCTPRAAWILIAKYEQELDELVASLA